jgi:hypothetical protein
MKSKTVYASKSSPASGKIYRTTGGFLYAASSNFKRVTGRKV